MKKLHIAFIVATLALVPTYKIDAKQKSQIPGASPYTYAPRLFTAEDKATGQYWAGDGSKKYPGKAFVNEIEYINVIAMNHKEVDTKANKSRRKNKEYLGSYLDEQTGQAMYLYGTKKIADKVDDSPDADVITQIAIKEDYGPGE